MDCADIQEARRAIRFKVAILSLTVLLSGAFWLSVGETSNSLGIVVTPSVPREGEPMVVTFKLNNASPKALLTSYEFYANSQLLTKGNTTLLPASSETHRIAYENPLQIGEQVNFMVKTQSELGNHEEVLSLPSYPPQIWSSFISFASVSISLMSSMSTMTYYQNTFGGDIGFNVGLLFSIILAVLLIFLELSQPLLAEKTILILGNLRLRLNTITWILLIIFTGIVYTTMVMVITG